MKKLLLGLLLVGAPNAARAQGDMTVYANVISSNINTNTTGVIVSSMGTVGTPSIQIGQTLNGIFGPNIQSVAIEVGGTEALRATYVTPTYLQSFVLHQFGSGASVSSFTTAGNLVMAAGDTISLSGTGAAINFTSPNPTISLASGGGTITGPTTFTSSVTFNAGAKIPSITAPVTSNSSITVNSNFQTQGASVTAAAYFGVQIATQAAGAAGGTVSVSCPANLFALSGGCSCTGTAVGAVTSVINIPYPTPTAGGGMPTGWQCQQADVTTGLSCAAFVICSQIQN